ncbi:MAG: hypothetical protein AB1791_00885 [Chloroflexota bacterium]
MADQPAPGIVFDPEDSFGQIGTDDLTAAKLARPEIVQILVQMRRDSIYQLRVVKADLERAQGENTQIRQARENLLVENAKLQERIKSSWLEIPISMLSGYAINLLATNAQNGVGWFLLIISLLMLAFLRGSQVSSALDRLASRRKGENEHG